VARLLVPLREVLEEVFAESRLALALLAPAETCERKDVLPCAKEVAKGMWM
jgi:hypothetical protein